VRDQDVAFMKWPQEHQSWYSAKPKGAESVAIRPATMRDVDFLVALEKMAFSTDLLSRRSFKDLIASRSADVLIAESAGKRLGYAVVLYRANASLGRVYSVAVEPGNLRSGIGSLLLRAAETACQARGLHRVRLEVEEGNVAAISMYTRLGYVLAGRTEGYYENGAPALRLEKHLR
jgi:ribosomal-protein-alanine N-acetyltransferase